jgi:uncharacterized repeat protein (TIGR03803 family)
LAACLATLGTLIPATAGAVEFAILHQFDGTHGAEPFGGIALDESTGSVFGVTVSGGIAGKGVLWRVQGHHYDVLHAFHGGPFDGDSGFGSVAFDASGRLVGTTAWGGRADAGTAWAWDTAGGYRMLVSMPGGTAGRGLQAGLTPAADGNYYGAALYGGDPACDCGTIFRIDGATGAVDLLRAFTGTDGRYPVSPPLVAGGTLHGTTLAGGAGDAGTAFVMGTDGGGYVDQATAGSTQFVAGLVADASGALWGAYRGGDVDNGGLYRIGPDGSYAVVYRFAWPNGYWPTGTLLVGRDGALYGTTTGGGRRGAGTVFRYDPASGIVRTIHAFNGLDGAAPQAGLVQDSAGRLFGVASGGGNAGAGVLFMITP